MNSKFKKIVYWSVGIFIVLPIFGMLIEGKFGNNDNTKKTETKQPTEIKELTEEQKAIRDANIEKAKIEKARIEEEKKIADQKQKEDEELKKAELEKNKSLWEYQKDEDKMRNSVTNYAHLKSDNSIDLGFPYDNSTMDLVLRKDSKEFVILMKVKGQFNCRYQDCFINAKFDDEEIKKYPYVRAGDGSTDTVFIDKEKEFFSKLKSSKKLIIEVVLYNRGSQQYFFTTKNLNFDMEKK